MKRLQKSSLSDDVVDAILDYINVNNLVIGDKLPTTEEICDSLGVSRTAVREGVRALQDRGLIESVPGRGSFVASPDVKVISRAISSLLILQQINMDEVFKIRRCLEVFLAREAAIKATDEQRDAIKAAFKKLKNASSNVDDALIADRDFHCAIAEASGNRLGVILVDAIMQLAVEMRRTTFRVDTDFVEMHSRITDSIDNQDPDILGDAMMHHFNSMDKILGQLTITPNTHNGN